MCACLRVYDCVSCASIVAQPFVVCYVAWMYVFTSVLVGLCACVCFVVCESARVYVCAFVCACVYVCLWVQQLRLLNWVCSITIIPSM